VAAGVGERGQLRQHPPPHLAGVANTQVGADAVLPIDAARDRRPLIDTQRGRFDCLPDVDVWVSGNENVRVAHLTHNSCFFRALDQVIDEHTYPPARRGRELANSIDEVVDAVEWFDNDAFDAQVVTPDPFDECGVVHSLDPDAAGACDARRRPRDGVRAGCCLRPRLLLRHDRGRANEGHDLTREEEPGRQHREDSAIAVPVLERDDVALLPRVHRSTDGDDSATEPAVCRFHDEISLGRDLGHLPAPAGRLSEDVPVVVHDRRLYCGMRLPQRRHASLTSGFVLNVRSGPLAAWAAAFFAGRVSVDQAADAVIGNDTPHQVGGLPAFDFELVPLREVLIAWRRRGGSVRAVFPVAGDVRGLPGPAAFRSAALEHGEAVVGPGLGVAPEAIEYSPSSAPPTVLWQAFEIEKAPIDYADRKSVV